VAVKSAAYLTPKITYDPENPGIIECIESFLFIINLNTV
jgi:hypothetical protein